MLTTRLSRLLITLPLLGLSVAMLPMSSAQAAGAAEEAVRLLAKARTADGRCGYLSGSERAELSRFAARAEIAAASQSGPRAAKSAAAAGSAEGRSPKCSTDLESDVRETLDAARQAVALANSEKDPEPSGKTVKQAAAGSGRKAGGLLSRYDRVVRAYYLERECRSLSKRDAGEFWSGIVRMHKSAVAANGAAAVEPLMRKAEHRAKSTSCGNRAMAEIREGYDEIVSR